MNKVVIIAEIGPNHNGNLSLAKKYVDIISQSGADYIKLISKLPPIGTILSTPLNF